MPTEIFYDPIFLKHETGRHPECKDRLVGIAGLLDKNSKYKFLKPREATQQDLELNHSPEYIAYIKSVCDEGGGMLDADTVVSSLSFRAACFAAGAMLEAIDRSIKKQRYNAFCCVRPPGHHAEHKHAMGFCLFNNVAIGAKYAHNKYNINRILIIDFDLHHGNGTQDSFYNDNKVLYFSVHQYPYYPGTGSFSETGEGKGRGLTINAPLPAGSTDKEYVSALKEILTPKALIFKPELILISAGFDAYIKDPLGGMKITIEGFKEIGKAIKSISEKTCNKTISVLEGGYNINDLPLCVEAYLEGIDD